MNANLHSQVSGIAYGLPRGMTGTLDETHKDDERFAFPSSSSTSRYPLQPYHELRSRESLGRPHGLCAKTFIGLRSTPTGECTDGSRRKRELTPVEQKDTSYWVKRGRNNEAARRSRQRRRTEEFLLETRAVELLHENEKLKATLSAVQYSFTPAGDHHEIPPNRLITKDCFRYPTTHTPLSHNHEVPKDLFSDRFAYFANPLAPPHFDSYHSFSLNAASSVPTVTSSANFDPTLLTPPATLQTNEYSSSRNATTHREDIGHHFMNYAPGTFDFQQGCKLFQDMQTIYPHDKVPASGKNFDSYSCVNGVRSPGRLEQHTYNDYANQLSVHSQQECYVKDKLSTQKPQGSGEHVSFLPHKLRFKATSNKVRTEQRASPNSARGKVVEIPSKSDTEVLCQANVGETAHNITIPLNPRQTHSPKTIQHKGARGFSSLWQSSDHTVSTREEVGALENTRTCAPQNNGPFAFSIFRQLSNNDSGNHGKLCQGMQSAFLLEHERETGDGGLRKQLASLSAEVMYLKQVLLAKSTA